MKCKSCGWETDEGDNFCSQCGTKLKEICTYCWVKKKDNYSCGERSCPGHGLYVMESVAAAIGGVKR